MDGAANGRRELGWEPSPASRGAGCGGLHCSGARPCLHLVSGSELEIRVLLPGSATHRQGTAWSPGASLTDSPGQALGGLERVPGQEGLGIPPGPVPPGVLQGQRWRPPSPSLAPVPVPVPYQTPAAAVTSLPTPACPQCAIAAFPSGGQESDSGPGSRWAKIRVSTRPAPS